MVRHIFPPDQEFSVQSDLSQRRLGVDPVELLETAQIKLNEARKNLPAMRAISNDDMDPKNIMWHEGKAYAIEIVWSTKEPSCRIS